MAFLVAGTLRVAVQMADIRESLGRKGRYSVLHPRVALMLSSPGVPAVTIAALEGVLRALGFESLEQKVVPVQSFSEELVQFREQLDAQGDPISCTLVALVTLRGQLRWPLKLAQELNGCGVLWGCPKLFLLLSIAPGVTPESGSFLHHLAELCGHCPHWSLLQLLTEVFRRVTESAGGTFCPVLRSSLRGALCLGNVQAWESELDSGLKAQYDLSGVRVALLLGMIRGRPGAQCDMEALGSLCQTLGFETTVRTDPTAQAFQEELAKFQEQLTTCRDPVSCALVALMAHGGPQGRLLGADGQEVQPEALLLELSRCEALQGCPKIFLLQACRGGHRDLGVATTVSWFWRRLCSRPPTIPSHADVLQVYADVQGSSFRGHPPRTADHADILMVYSAAEGCVAYRDDKGSDFIQTLVEVVGADPGRDLLELMTEVNRQVCELDVLGPDSDKPHKACLEIRSSLRRSLCLRA
ncbi:PREDICTED: caspase-14 [Chrysochloris asiatica]|uniref:Caspase-14 n=1 Tax=Chrysochloris asiatica TaxID=185453 RepID=A0A9B0U139_CHRAS|nr:PREDICTED: caspase-14 [Chrysochloris asiatica]